MKKKSDNCSVNDCTSTGIVWDKSTLDVINVAAKKGLFNLTELFKPQNVKIDCLLKIGGSSDPKEST